MNTQGIIDAADDAIRLDRWFKRYYPGLQHALLEKYLRKGLIRLDGQKTQANARVLSGQTLSFPPMEQEVQTKRAANSDQAEKLRALVLYKDAQAIAINKPAGLAVQGGSKISTSLDDLLGALQFDARERPRLVHRLDRDTSGVLLLARSAKSAGLLSECFADKTAVKTYLALVVGAPFKLSGIIDLPLLKALSEGGREFVAVDKHQGKHAVTEYRVIDTCARKFALLELKPLTGRTHQLRVHMQALGCPILGDGKYGGVNDDARSLGVSTKLHLHARRIVLPPLAKGAKAIDVSAPLPEHMVKSFKALGLEAPSPRLS